MSIKLDKYMPLYAYLSPASIPQIVAHIQDYLVKHPILSVETIAEIIVQSLQEHPELINGEAIPISADSAQSIKAYIDALPALDTYTKAEINALLLGKQDTLTFDQAPTPGSSNPVTSSGIIAAMSALQSALETQISAKADRASTYTKTQVDTLLEDKADADDVYTKNTMDAKLLEVNTNIDNLETAVSHQSQQIDNLQSDLAGLAFTGTTNTSGNTIKQGTFFWLNDVLCVAKTDILNGATFTENTNYRVMISGALNEHQKNIINTRSALTANANEWTYTGASVTIPAKCFYAITGKAIYSTQSPIEVAIQKDQQTPFELFRCIINSGGYASIAGYTDIETTFYLYGKWNGPGAEDGEITGWYEKIIE